jgi:hypothetical protein
LARLKVVQKCGQQKDGQYCHYVVANMSRWLSSAVNQAWKEIDFPRWSQTDYAKQLLASRLSGWPMPPPGKAKGKGKGKTNETDFDDQA